MDGEYPIESLCDMVVYNVHVHTCTGGEGLKLPHKRATHTCVKCIM